MLDSSRAHQYSTSWRQGRLKSLFPKRYGEDKMPMVLQSDASMLTTLADASGAAFDRQFHEQVIMHYEAIKMVDQFLPRLTNPKLKQMAEKMKADQTRQIAELRKELK